jgi:hypothetical protein
MSLYGKTDIPQAIPKFLEIGQIQGVTISSGGTGYVTPTVAFTGGGGTGATGTVTVSGGVITGITITNAGSGYTTAPTAVITPTGGGTGVVVGVVKIAANNYLAGNIVYVDQTEALLAANKAKGITQSGWYFMLETTDQDGNIRYKTELLVATKNTSGLAGDSSDDSKVADLNAVVTISVQPTNQTTISGAATFGVTATVAPSGTATYQWQTRISATAKWVIVVGQVSATIALTGKTVANTGNQYRVLVGSDNGAVKVPSSAATLTFGS